MMKKLILITSLALPICSFSSDMDEAYAKAKNNSAQNNANTMELIRKTKPVYDETNTPEVYYRSELTTQEASKKFALKDPKANAQYHSALKTIEEREPVDPFLLSEGEKISTHADQYISKDGFCQSGDCHTLVDVPNEDMIQSAAVLEDVLGGAQSYTDSGTEARIYTGNKETCKKDNWGFADCCTDEGWGVNLSLASCPEETKALGELHEQKLCHHVGRYREVTRVLGAVVLVEEFESYCCYTSKMGRATQEGARDKRQPNLKLKWGSPRSPSCRGLTPDEFSSIDFTLVDLEDIYDDIDAKVVEPKPEELLQKPQQYYNEVGIASW